MTEIKSCITCAHCENPDGKFYIFCNKYTYETVDYVKGEVYEWRKYCANLREPGGKCGPEGNGWEQMKEHPPENKITIKQKWKSFLYGFFDLDSFMSLEDYFKSDAGTKN